MSIRLACRFLLGVYVVAAVVLLAWFLVAS